MNEIMKSIHIYLLSAKSCEISSIRRLQSYSIRIWSNTKYNRLLLSANRKSYMPRRLAQQRMTSSDLEWPFHASRVISAVAEPLVLFRVDREATG